MALDLVFFKIWGFSPLKGLNLCFNIMNVKLCLLNQELAFFFLNFNYFSSKFYKKAHPPGDFLQIWAIFSYFSIYFYKNHPPGELFWSNPPSGGSCGGHFSIYFVH